MAECDDRHRYACAVVAKSEPRGLIGESEAPRDGDSKATRDWSSESTEEYPNELSERALRLVAEAKAEDPDLSLNPRVLRIGPESGSCRTPSRATSRPHPASEPDLSP